MKMFYIVDTLVTASSFLSVFYQSLHIFCNICSIFNIDTIVQFRNMVVMPISFFVTSSGNPCFCTWLCVHFCLKIVKIDHQIYVFIQRKFQDMFLWILVPSVLGSLLVSIPLAFGIQKRGLLNKTLEDFVQMPPLAHSAEFIAYATVSTAGFLLCSVSALTIIFSLLRHIINLRRNSQCLKGSSIKSHVKAATTVFLLFGANDISLIFIMIPILQFDKIQWIPISSKVYALLQCISSLNLIAGNAILNKALRDILKNCLCSQRK